MASSTTAPAAVPSAARTRARIAACAFAAAYVGLAIIGVVREYVPVPFQDRWSAVHFDIALAPTGWRAWWAQHNEHRIVLPRVADWLDCRLFACHGASLIALDFVLLAIVWLLLYRLARALLRGSAAFERPYVIALLLAVICFSWLQRENLVQGFQITFVASCLFALGALAAMARSAIAAKSLRWFALATALGVAAAVTMANGLVVTPLLVAMALLLRQRPVRVAFLAACAVALAVAYLTDYDVPSQHVSVTATFAASPLRASAFALAVIGGPVGKAVGSVAAAAAAGAAIVAIVLAVALRWPAQPSPHALALIAFFAYAVISAVAVAGGRLALGMAYALSSRYFTLSLLAWAAALVLSLWLVRGERWMPRALSALAVIVPVAFFAAQSLALAPDGKRVRIEHTFAALDLELGVHDATLARVLFPSDDLYSYAEEARRRRLAPFDAPALVGLRETLGRDARTLALRGCDGHIDPGFAVDGQPGTTRVTGTVRDAAAPLRVYFVTADDRVVGAAVTFVPTFDWRRWIGRIDATPFGGYVIGAAPDGVRLACPPA